MARVTFKTPLGAVWAWGDRAKFESSAPVILVIPGALCGMEALWFRMQDQLPEAAVLAAQLPGQFCPNLTEVSLDAYVRAFGHVIQMALGDRPVLVCGESIGGVVALALPNLGIHRLALDPPLRTAGLWPLEPFFKEIYRKYDYHREFLDKIFGFDGEQFRELDYMPLLRHPARVLMGGIALQPERDLERNFLPSLVGEPERGILRSLNYIHDTTVVGSGHVLVWNVSLIIDVLRAELQRGINNHRLSQGSWVEDDPSGPGQ